MAEAIDWKLLRDRAIEAARGAYAPYSGFPVGAAALVDDRRVVTGCNVENVSYGLGLCAECAVVCALHSTGGGRLLALACVDGSGAPLMPCGRCRQVLLEHGMAMFEALARAFEADAATHEKVRKNSDNRRNARRHRSRG